jgi:glyoxylase-like metal-dependent hydrolase (beta-lactamase superfamily II)
MQRANLAAAGFASEDIDYVMCTHLHANHVGWNTRLVHGRWMPTFANARYLFARQEWEYWERAEIRARSSRPVSPCGQLHRSHPQGRDAGNAATGDTISAQAAKQ